MYTSNYQIFFHKSYIFHIKTFTARYNDDTKYVYSVNKNG